MYRGLQTILKKIHVSTTLLFLAVVVGFLFFSFEPTAFAQAGGTSDSGIGGWIFQAFLEGTGKFIAYVLLFISSILAMFLGTVSYLFNTAMLLTVFRFADYFGNSDGLLLAWTILRDIANIVLLFGFVFMGIATILDVDLHRYNAKKAIPMLVIFAILLNFSLFAAEAVVDVANSVSASFYTQAAGGVDCGSDEGIQTCAEDGLAGKIVQATGLAGILNFSSIDSYESIWNADGSEGGLRAAVLFFVLFMVVVTTIIVLLAATVMLVSRAVVLAIVFITSPIGFAGMAIPPLQGLSKQWWDALINNALFAPVFVLLVLVGLKILEGLYGALGVTTDQNLLSVLLSDDPRAGVLTGNVFVMFAFAIGFFIAALLVAQHLGLSGAKAVVGNANKWMGRAAGFGAFGLPAFAYRQTAGRAFDVTSRVARRAGLPVVPFIGRPLTQMLDYGATASGDLRGSGMVGDRFGKVGEFSPGTKKGMRGVDKQAAERRITAAKEVEGARGEWRDWRDLVSGQMDKTIGKWSKSINPITRFGLAPLLKFRKGLYDKHTETKYLNNPDDWKKYKQHQRDKSTAEREIKILNQNPQPNDPQWVAAMKKQTDILESTKKAVEKLTRTGNFGNNYADELTEFGSSIWRLGYNMKGVKEAAVSLKAHLGKSKDDRVMDDLKAMLKAAKQNTP